MISSVRWIRRHGIDGIGQGGAVMRRPGCAAMTEERNHQTPAAGVEMSTREHQAAKMPAGAARQGAASGRVRLVLRASLALVVIAFAIIYFMHF